MYKWTREKWKVKLCGVFLFGLKPKKEKNVNAEEQ